MSRKPIAVRGRRRRTRRCRTRAGRRSGVARGIRIAAVGDIACKNRPKQQPAGLPVRRRCRRDRARRTTTGSSSSATSSTRTAQVHRTSSTTTIVTSAGSSPSLSPCPATTTTAPRMPPATIGTSGRIGQEPDGYYSYDLGSWHIVAFNSAICPAATGCGPGDPQYRVAAEPISRSSDAVCTLAYWHHPRWDWLHYQNAELDRGLRMAPFEALLWILLSAAHADVVLGRVITTITRGGCRWMRTATRTRTGSASSSRAAAAAT